MKITSLAAALLLPLAVLAQPAPLLSIDDPEGDDFGDGRLSYPREGAIDSGDLDLRSLRVLAAEGGLRFEASFANPIRDPSTVRARGLGTEDLSVFARRGFYAFNLDIYIDLDRVSGSGNTATLPGRRAVFDPAQAWEKAIVLTPRPELMRRQLHEALAAAAPAGSGDVGAVADASVFFATEVRVRGRSVSFFVPASFLGGLQVQDWSLAALVTAAKLNVEAELSLGAAPAAGALERLSLGALQPQQGRPLASMGYSGEPAPATAIVDLLAPVAGQQARQLAAGATLAGLNRDNRYGASTVLPAVPAAAAAPAAPEPQDRSWFGRALDAVARVLGGGAAAATASAPAPAAVATPSLGSLLQPQAQPAAATAVATPAAAVAPVVTTPAAAVTPAAVIPAAVAPPARPVAAPAAAPAAAAAAPVPVPAPAATPAAVRPRDAAHFEEQEQRMRTLKRLRDGGLISEEEFQQKRREILDKL